MNKKSIYLRFKNLYYQTILFNYNIENNLIWKVNLLKICFKLPHINETHYS